MFPRKTTKLSPASSQPRCASAPTRSTKPSWREAADAEEFTLRPGRPPARTRMVFEEQHGGRASALEILNGQFTAYYSNGEQNVLLRDESDRAAPALGDTQDKRKRQP